MTIAELFHRHPAPEPALLEAAGLCVHCNGLSMHPVLEGDGAQVCLPCVYRLGSAAKDPANVPEHMRMALLEAHDAVELSRAPYSRKLGWSWILPWPNDDTTLGTEEERMAVRLHFHMHDKHLVPGCVYCETGPGGLAR